MLSITTAVLVNAEHHDGAGWGHRPHFLSRLNAVHTRHFDIHNHDVRMQLFGQCQCGLTIPSFPHDHQVGFERKTHLQTLSNAGPVVN
ncbi:MAG: hypothetical protein M1546_04850 [Chloroflexi bacterium]|nr:hypothetical protein [Chloroflexota bacterium]